MEKLIRIGEACRRLGVHSTTLWRMESKGLIKAQRNINGYRFFKASDIEKLKDKISPK